MEENEKSLNQSNDDSPESNTKEKNEDYDAKQNLIQNTEEMEKRENWIQFLESKKRTIKSYYKKNKCF
jgi:hypothetical protein